MIFYDLKSGYHYHITTIISTKINCLVRNGGHCSAHSTVSTICAC